MLIVEDEPSSRFMYARYFNAAGYDVSEADTAAMAREKLSSHRFDAILLDMNLPDGRGIDLLAEIKEYSPETAVIIATGQGDIPTAVEAMRQGADNFLTKPLDMNELDVFIKKSMELTRLRRNDTAMKRTRQSRDPFLGQSEASGRVRELLSVVAGSDSTVLFTGETGTGKGVMARWLHDLSQRRNGPYIEVNCSALRGELLASELMGHAKGSFTSAIQSKQGLLEVADRGTLFLDEIGDMDIGVQAQFLKVIEEKVFRRIGETALRHSNFRLLCATNRDLEADIQMGRFRKDLYYRISTFPIRIPQLSERRPDIRGFVVHFLGQFNYAWPEPDQAIISLLEGYEWPGNIRELRNVIERAILLSRGEPLRVEHFIGLISGHAIKKAEPINACHNQRLDEVERSHLKEMYGRLGGDVDKMARELGVSRATAYRKLKKLKDIMP